MMIKKSKTTQNAVRILAYLVEKDAIGARSIKVKEIFESVGLSESEFDSADTYLLEQKYVEGTMGGYEGIRWLTGQGIEYYETSSFEPEAIPNTNTADHSAVHPLGRNAGEEPMANSKKVFVVHGRDDRLRGDFFLFLRELGLDPLEWSEALRLTGKSSPYIGEVLDSAFSTAQAIIVLLSPEDEVKLTPELCGPEEEGSEKEFMLQPRANVLFEAGMAFGRKPDRTILIEVGSIKRFSDVAGRHVVRLSNNVATRKEVAQRLKSAGCSVSTSGNDWLTVGNFSVTRRITGTAVQESHQDSLKALVESDILAILTHWWATSTVPVQGPNPDPVKVDFEKLDVSLSLPSGSAEKYISQISAKYGYKCTLRGNAVALFEYDFLPLI